MNTRLHLLLGASVLLAACDPVTLGLMTAGGGVAVNRQMSSTITRTFSQGAEPVQTALLAALDRMSIQVTHHEKRGEVDVYEGVAGKRAVTLQLEPVTRTSTLIEVAVRQDLLTLDGATGREIVAQTELALAQQGGTAQAVTNAPGAAPAALAANFVYAPGKTTYYGYDRPASGNATVAKATKPRLHAQPAGSSNVGTPGPQGELASTGSRAADASDARQGSMSRRPPVDHLAAAAAP